MIQGNKTFYNTLLATIPKKGTSVTLITDFIGADNLVWYNVEYDGIEGYIRSDFIETK